MLHCMPKEPNVSQPIFVLALASTGVGKATLTKSNEWKKYWRAMLQNDIQLYSTMLLSIFIHFKAQIVTKNVCMYGMFLKSNAFFTFLLLPSFDHRFPKLFPQCKSKRHSNGVSYLPVLLKSSPQLVVALYFSKKTYVLHDFRRICIDWLENIRIRKSLCSSAFPYWNNTFLLVSYVQWKGRNQNYIKDTHPRM